jgi:hypothetical protein
MPEINSWLENIAEVQEILAELDSNHEERRAEVIRQLNTLISRVRSRVKEGATTGDPVQDYVLLAFHTFGGEISERYKELAKLVGQHAGELVLQYELKEKAGSLFPGSYP